MWNIIGPIALLFGVAAAGVVGFAASWYLSNTLWRTPQSLLVCDWAVSELLHSDELIEVERAGSIIRALDCNVARRVPKDWSPPDK